MKRLALSSLFALFSAAFCTGASAQQATPVALNAAQALGQKTYAQHCGVCHTKPTILSPYYGPALSKDIVNHNEDVLRDFIDRPIDAAHLQRAKTRLVADAIYAQDSQASLARWYGEALATGLSVADVESWPSRMEAVTTDSVAAAARQWLDKRRSVTGFLLPV